MEQTIRVGWLGRFRELGYAVVYGPGFAPLAHGRGVAVEWGWGKAGGV